MLTNIFYYNYYKPYILKTVDSGKQQSKAKIPKIADNSSSTDSFKVLLNKSLKPEVVDYARGVSGSIVGTKEAAKNLVRDMSEFNKNAYKRGSATAKSWIKYDLEEFAGSYNTSTEFLSSQKHSQSLRGFSERLTDNVNANLEQLSQLGLRMNDDGKLSVDTDAFNGLDENRLNLAIGETLNTFNDIYADSGGVLTEPLKDHMNFRGLGYYYNYKLGRMENDTFKIIESGMIIDKVV